MNINAISESEPTSIQTRAGVGKRKRDWAGEIGEAAHPTETRSPRARVSCLDEQADGNTSDDGPSGGDDRHPPMTEEDLDIQHHKQITAQRNFDKVNFGKWQIKTWYFSPYPLMESEVEDPTPDSTGPPASPGSSAQSPAPRGRGRPPGSTANRPPKIPGVQRTTLRSHGRTSDLLAGGLTRSHLTGDKSVLWVCERCFKYMSEGSVWEMHAKRCDRRHPPGRKVYQRGAHTIWEVDGAAEKLYCQNLSLFGKFFIDVKTLFFDCDNFLFYILTDADSQRDHVLGFFSKEKYSYDDYNLACIIVLPPYQRKGYGMLMIEFSYELSRRSGKVGTPERPLSELGLRSYLTYWVATLVRFLRRLLSVLPPDCANVTTEGWVSMPLPLSQTQTPAEVSHAHTPLPQSQPHTQTQALPISQTPTQLPPAEDIPTPGLSTPTIKRKRGPKGWDGEIDPSHDHLRAAAADGNAYDIFTPLRKIVTVPNERDGSATSHVVVHCTLVDIARATNLRVEDAAFALCECGLLEGMQAVRHEGVTAVSDSTNSGGIMVTDDAARAPVRNQASDEQVVVGITREMVEIVAKERRVKEMCLSLAHVLL
ncbi:acyl-CoA N-acyltransferase [Scleroderma yunnanense]